MAVGVVAVQWSTITPEEVAVGLVRLPLCAVPGQPGVRRRSEGVRCEVGVEEVAGAVDELVEVPAGSGRTERG